MANKKDYSEYPRKERFAKRYPYHAHYMKEELEAKHKAAKELWNSLKNAPKNIKEFFKEATDLTKISRKKGGKKRPKQCKTVPCLYDIELLQEQWTPKKKSKQKIKKIKVPVSEQEKPGVVI